MGNREPFHERLNKAKNESGISVPKIAQKAGINRRTLEKWFSVNNPIMPAIDDAVAVATILDTPTEILVDGEAGREYILSWAARHGASDHAPEGIKEIVEDLLTLPPDKLRMMREMIHAAAAGERPPTEAPVRQSS